MGKYLKICTEFCRAEYQVRIFLNYSLQTSLSLDTGKGVHVGGMKIPYLLYANDLVFMSEGPSGIQNLIRGLENFCTQWHMVVNLTKTKVVVFNERFANGDNSSFYFNKKKIPASNFYNYLGVIFSNANDRFYDNYENKRGKALRAIYAARNLAHGVIGPDVSQTILFKIFDTQIQPIVDYGSEIFYDRKPKPRLESLQTTYLKRAQGVRAQTSNLAILCELGRCPLIARQEKLILGYWLKLTTVPTPNPLRLVYDELYRLSMAGHTTWCSHVRELLKSIGLSDIWEDQKTLISAESINQLKSLFKIELERYYTRNWLKDINNAEKHPILRTYTVFKEKLCLETYIQCMPIKKYQQAISRFRVSSHRLGIELGRHKKPYLPVEKRLRHFCRSGNVDDEYHFLIHCGFHAVGRKMLYSTACQNIINFEELRDQDKFKEILISRNEKVIFSLGKFIYEGFKSRDLGVIIN